MGQRPDLANLCCEADGRCRQPRTARVRQFPPAVEGVTRLGLREPKHLPSLPWRKGVTEEVRVGQSP